MAQATSGRTINLRNKFIARMDKWNVFRKGKPVIANRKNYEFLEK
jgi:hypothetical protein